MMKSENSHSRRGFSLIELMVAMAVGLVIMGGATALFKSGMDATMLVTQQAEMQQNVRAGLNLIAKDVSMAGSGLPTGGLALPYGTGATPSVYGCDQTSTCYVNANTYPTGTIGGAAVSNYMYGLIPGPNTGMKSGSWTPTIPVTGAIPDRVTSIYADYSFPLSQYNLAFNNGLGTSIKLTPPVGAPPGFPAIISPTGINVGDLLLLRNGNGSAVGEVTDIAPAVGGATNITFANSDPLNINQSGAASANIKFLASGAPSVTIANRLYAISYYIEVPPASTQQTPRLMRQVNGLKPQPVADNIIGLKITYDACDNTNSGGPTPTCAALPDPISSGYSPNNIHKVNIQVMGQGVLSATNRSRSMALVTSVSTRSLSFKSRY
jgi:prepilin-type N-terminal cleavage/methylation domain-containing protein